MNLFLDKCYYRTLLNILSESIFGIVLVSVLLSEKTLVQVSILN